MSVPFEELPQAIKGELGENIVREHLIIKNLVPYKAQFDGAHPFDFLCATRDKKNLIIAEVKAKARMSYKIEGHYRTGIDTRHYNEYIYLRENYNLPIHIYFIDEFEECIYGNDISKLEEGAASMGTWYPPMTLFKLSEMKKVGELNSTQVSKLKEISLLTRKHDYPKEKIMHTLFN